jgi:hypothetical protein
MRSLLVFLCSPLLATAVLWTVFAACVDEPLPPSAPLARLVAAWDPLACGPPHRVVLELDGDDDTYAVSVPCNLGGLAIDVSHFGTYRGRIYAWAPDAAIRSITAVDLSIDQPLVHWFIATPR